MKKFLTSVKTLSRRAKRGFTLIELLVVITIIGILAAALIPTIGDLTGVAKTNTRGYVVKQLNNLLQQKTAANGGSPALTTAASALTFLNATTGYTTEANSIQSDYTTADLSSSKWPSAITFNSTTTKFQ